MKQLLFILIMLCSFVDVKASEPICFNNKAIVITRDSTAKEQRSSYLIFTIEGKKVGGGAFTSIEERFPIERLSKGTYIVYVFIDNRVYKKMFSIIA